VRFGICFALWQELHWRVAEVNSSDLSMSQSARKVKIPGFFAAISCFSVLINALLTTSMAAFADDYDLSSRQVCVMLLNGGWGHYRPSNLRY
jgi:hypothetical protein